MRLLNVIRRQEQRTYQGGVDGLLANGVPLAAAETEWIQRFATRGYEHFRPLWESPKNTAAISYENTKVARDLHLATMYDDPKAREVLLNKPAMARFAFEFFNYRPPAQRREERAMHKD